MGLFDWKHWIVILLVIVLIFGTRRLKTLGSDLGETIKGFRKAMHEEPAKPDAGQASSTQPPLENGTTSASQGQGVEEPARKS